MPPKFDMHYEGVYINISQKTTPCFSRIVGADRHSILKGRLPIGPLARQIKIEKSIPFLIFQTTIYQPTSYFC